MTASRRDFIKAAGAAVAATAMTASVARAEVATDETAWDYEADVVVCGCGNSGDAAAIDAFDAGAEVCVIEKKDWIGGQLHRCGGGEMGIEEYMYGPGLNIGWMPETFEELGMKPVARCHWFTKNPDDPFCGDESKHLFPTAGGTGLWKTFADALEARGIEPLTETGLTRLITAAGSNEVVGVVAEQADGTEIRIKARRGVVVSTGNFASNHEMFKNYCGWDFENSVNGGNAEDLVDDNDGTGIKALLGVGCELVFPSKSPKVASYDNKCAFSYLCGGVKINTSAQAIDVFGDIVPRLYVASMAAGGVLGDTYPVCGSSVVRNFVFGRIAGQGAAAEEPWC